MYVDDAWMAWGQAVGIEFLEDVVIEHLHPTAGKSETDASYETSEALMAARRRAVRRLPSRTPGDGPRKAARCQSLSRRVIASAGRGRSSIGSSAPAPSLAGVRSRHRESRDVRDRQQPAPPARATAKDSEGRPWWAANRYSAAQPFLALLSPEAHTGAPYTLTRFVTDSHERQPRSRSPITRVLRARRIGLRGAGEST